MSLDVYLETNIFDPLKMKDTFFELPKEKIDRFTTLYNKDKKDKNDLPVEDMQESIRIKALVVKRRITFFFSHQFQTQKIIIFKIV